MYFPEDGAAPAAAEPVTPIQGADGAAARPEPEARSVETVARPRETTRTALDRAFATVEQQEADEVEEATGNKPATPGTPGRDERGRFKAGEQGATDALESDPKAIGKDGKAVVADGKPPATGMEAPTRFSPDAKAAWKDVPDPVKGEVSRAVRELETGIREYQQVFEPLKPFYQMAQEHGVQVHEALKNYVAIDQALVSKDPQERLSTIEHLLGLAGISPKEYAAYISGQPADQAQSQNDRTISELRQEIAGLKNQLGGVTQTIAQRREDETLRQVEAFAEANPRLKEPEFQKSVFRLLETKMAADLQSAFDMAMRLNPPPVVDAQTTAASAAADKPNSDQTRKGKFSIAGAPTSGSNPANRKPPASARESIDRVFAEMGLTG